MNDDQHNTPNEHQQNSEANQRPHLDTAWSPVADAMRHDIQINKTKQGNPIDPADPGTSGSRMIALLLSVLLAATVVLWQNTGEDLKFQTLLGKSPPPVEILPTNPAPGNYGQVDLLGRMFLRGYDLFKSQPIMSQFGESTSVFSNEDNIRLIMIAGEYEGTDSALERIHALQEKMITVSAEDDNMEIQVGADELIIDELIALEVLYHLGVDTLEPEHIQQLTDRYGLIAKVALTHGLDDSDPLRAPLISNGTWIIFFLLIGIAGAVLVPIVGGFLLILGIVYMATGKMVFHSHVPKKGGSIFLETYALFVGGFLLMSIATFFVSNSSNPELASFSLLAQWLLLLTVLWGVVRKMSFTNWRKAIGWHTGQGVLKEIGIGIIAYIASIPIYIIGVLITVVLLIASEAIKAALNGGAPQEPESLTNPIFEMIASGSFVTIAMLFILATTWAPIVEEAIFRGALYRHLRGSMHWIVAALLSATLFAYMHDYGPLMVAPLIALGFMFAFMREWRGSLIAPMTAHFLHNFTLMSFMIILVQLIKDPI